MNDQDNLIAAETLADDLQGMLEMYYDTVSQHRAEVAGYGDSWPGAQIQIREMEGNIRAFAMRHGLGDPFAPPVPPPAQPVLSEIADDDIPF